MFQSLGVLRPLVSGMFGRPLVAARGRLSLAASQTTLNAGQHQRFLSTQHEDAKTTAEGAEGEEKVEEQHGNDIYKPQRRPKSMLDRYYLKNPLPPTQHLFRLAKGKRAADAERLLKALIRDNEIDAETVGRAIPSIITAYGLQGLPLEAIRFHRDAKELPFFEDSKYVTTSIMRACFFNGDSDGARHYLRQWIDKNGLPNDASFFNAMLERRQHPLKSTVIKKVIEEMRECKVSPDQRSFVLLINALGRERRGSDLEQVYQEAVRSCSPITHHLVSSYVQALSLCGLPYRAQEIINEHQGNMRLLTSVYNSLLLGFIVVKDVERAERLFEDMVQKRTSNADSYTYYLMMRMLVSEGLAERALQVFDLLTKSGLPYLPACYCYAMDAALQLQKIDFALELRTKMKSKRVLYTDRLHLPNSLPDLTWVEEFYEKCAIRDHELLGIKDIADSQLNAFASSSNSDIPLL